MSLGTCCKCKKNKAIAKFKSGVFCKGCVPKLNHSSDPIGIGIRFKTNSKGMKELKGKKGDLSRIKNRSMRCNMGMNYELVKS